MEITQSQFELIEHCLPAQRGNVSLSNLSALNAVQFEIEAVSLDSTSIKVHPDGTRALKNGPQAIGKPRGGWNTKIHMVAADARTAITFSLSPGQAHDAPGEPCFAD